VDSADEQPVVVVTLSRYRLGRYPVTNAEYRRFIDDHGYENPRHWTSRGWTERERRGWREPTYWREPPWNLDDVPVTGVSWWEALAYAVWINATLPTEAQWEYAAGGPEKMLYPWGEDPPTLDLANFSPECQPVERRPTSVHAHPRNRSHVGCCDMAGNFAEWCLDNARVGYLGDSTLVDPIYATSEEEDHIARGGSGLHDAGALKCTSRDYYSPGLRDNLIGFRLAAPGGDDGG